MCRFKLNDNDQRHQRQHHATMVRGRSKTRSSQTTKETMTIPSLILRNNMMLRLLRWCLLVLTVLCTTTAVSGQDDPNKGKRTTKTTIDDLNSSIELVKYLYNDDPSAVPVIEYYDTRKADFFATDKRRVVKFYSPYCVSGKWKVYR
jgi:hypothetical protein